MILEIEKSTKFTELQRQFSTAYPYLKLKFTRYMGNGLFEISQTEGDVEKLTVGEVKPLMKAVFFELHYWQKTGTIERQFLQRTGIAIRIFRKHKNHWIETSGTDDLTLEEQNDIGRKSSEAWMLENNRPAEIEKPI